MRFVGALIVWVVIAVIAGAVFIWSGVYDVAADSPDWPITGRLIGDLREHSIRLRSADVKPPALNDPALVKQGAEHYAKMCVGCHLAPGLTDTGIRQGLNPRPPNLTRFAPDPSEAFWIIKHGIKMTAMPAWGATHDDQTIWAMVAYLQRQPHMSAAEFHSLSANTTVMEDHGMAPASAATAPAPAATAPAPASSAR